MKNPTSEKPLVLYIHGQGGNAQEAEFYRALFPDCCVVGMDYTAQTPWQAREEFPELFARFSRKASSVILIANSIGAYFAMLSLQDQTIDRAYFISPIVDMEKLIQNRMVWEGITEEMLSREKVVPSTSGEPFSWEYLQYVRQHPFLWQIPTSIAYGDEDFLTSPETISRFAAEHGASLHILHGGAHWFHTPEQMRFLADWIRKAEM